MYNKLFTKILDSSIWLAPDPHRLVWITLIAAMDEDGNAMFASAANLAARARVTREQAEDAIRAFEGPDPDSGDPDNEGRRIERFPGGWHVLNAHKYREIVSRLVSRQRTRERTARWREKTANSVTVGDAAVTVGDAQSRSGDAVVTPSEAYTDTKAKDQKHLAPSDSIAPRRTPTIVGTMPLVGGGEWPVTVDHMATWTAAYPGIDAKAELRKAKAWLVSNPAKGKTAKGMARFCNTWLAKAQDDCGRPQRSGVQDRAQALVDAVRADRVAALALIGEEA